MFRYTFKAGQGCSALKITEDTAILQLKTKWSTGLKAEYIKHLD